MYRINLSKEFEVNSEYFSVIQYGVDIGHFKIIAERGKDKLVYVHSPNHLIG